MYVNVYRPGGPYALVTSRCLFMFDRKAKRFRLQSVHPGHTLEEILDHTGFSFDYDETVLNTPAPRPETLNLIRADSATKIADPYPRFAEEKLGYKPH